MSNSTVNNDALSASSKHYEWQIEIMNADAEETTHDDNQRKESDFPTFRIVAAVVAEEESNNQGRRTGYRGSILGHNIVNRNRKEVEAHNHNPYFKQRTDALGVLGLSCLQKVTTAHRILAYGIPADLTDKYLQIGESTTIESLRAFVKAIVEVFGDWYLKAPNEADVCRLLSIGEQRGFPGMLGSIDCMHWKWEKCPIAWHGMYTGHCREPTIILEAVASQDLWIWHAFFGMPGSLNDINVLDRSHIFATLAEGYTAPVNYTINGYEYTMGYYLADGIYSNWSTFVKTIPRPLGAKRKYFASKQESARRDVERAFRVLQSRFAIVRGPVRYWDEETLANIMKACIIMHNMIIEDEGAMNLGFDHEREVNSFISVSHGEIPELHDFLQTHNRIRDRATSSQLQEDLIEHLWEQYGNE
nr:uncharacterized protein LOC118057386 [Populus alba]